MTKTEKNRKNRIKKKLWLIFGVCLLLVSTILPTVKVEASSKIWNKVDDVWYNGEGVEIPDAITRGIDVSSRQGSINWTRVANSNIDFVFVRVGYDTNAGTLVEDTQFVNNISGANRASVPVGVYFQSVAKTTAQAEKEAEFVISKIQGYKVSYPVVIQRNDSKTDNELTNLQRANIVVSFCNKVEEAGYHPMLHCNAGWYLNYVEQHKISGIDKWIAAYGDEKTSLGVNAEHTIWQATDGSAESGLRSTAGLIGGIPSGSTVNINFGYVDYVKKIAPRTYRTEESVPISLPEKKQGWYTTKYGNTYYYVNGEFVTGWRTISGKRYYFSSAGRMQIGKKKIGSFYYYFSQKKTSIYPKGAMVKGWYRTTSGNRYYFNQQNGRMARSTTMIIDGKQYKFSSNGVCQKK